MCKSMWQAATALIIVLIPEQTVVSSAFALGQAPPEPALFEQQSGTSVLLQAVSPVSERIAWVSGHGGTFVRTVDGGDSWAAGKVANADSLQFRDVHGVDASTAYLLSAGPGESSRIYKTDDGGRTWRRQFTNLEPDGFFDCFGFWGPSRGIAFSDAVAGRLLIIRTTDGGDHWSAVAAQGIPPALPGEGGFAASGTCLVAMGDRHAWIGTGAGGAARVLRSVDGGEHWFVATTPIVSGTATSGIMALAFRDSSNGIAAGGELRSPGEPSDNIAVTVDGGRTWRLAERANFPGAVYGIAYVRGVAPPTVVAVGPGGASYSTSDGSTWESLSPNSYWSVGFGQSGVGWAVGPGGRISKIVFDVRGGG